MNMETEIIVVIIASAVSFILGIINLISNIRISSKQNEIELKKTKIDTLQNKSKKLNEILVEIVKRESNVTQLKRLEDVGELATFYSKNFNDVLTVSYLIDEKFSESLKTSQKKLQEYISNEGAGIPINYEIAFEDVKEMDELNQQIPIALEKELRKIERKIKKLLV